MALVLNGKYSVKANLNSNSNLFLNRNTIEEADGTYLCSVDSYETPDWLNRKINGSTKVGDLINYEFNSVLAVTLFGCELKNNGVGCKFCASKPFDGCNININEFKDALKIIAKCGDYQLTINAGSLISDRKCSYSLMKPYVQAAKEAGIKKMNLELMPSTDLIENERYNLLEELKEDRITSMQFNIEVWDDKLRKKIMPYKGKIPREVYLDYIKKASEVFGKGKVSSVLMIGIDGVKSLEEAVDEILTAGGIPSVEIFRPLKGTPMENFKPQFTNKEAAYLIIQLNKYIIEKVGCLPVEGCLKCGGCGNFYAQMVGDKND